MLQGAIVHPLFQFFQNDTRLVRRKDQGNWYQALPPGKVVQLLQSAGVEAEPLRRCIFFAQGCDCDSCFVVVVDEVDEMNPSKFA